MSFALYAEKSMVFRWKSIDIIITEAFLKQISKWLYQWNRGSHCCRGEIQDEFLEGRPCEKLHEEVYELKKKICGRLGVEEDKELEQLINLMDDINKNVALKCMNMDQQ